MATDETKINKTVMYTLKCQNGYVKLNSTGLQVVQLGQASVFKCLGDVLPAMEKASKLDGVCVVELTIYEREVDLFG